LHKAYGFNYIGKKDLAKQAMKRAAFYSRDGLTALTADKIKKIDKLIKEKIK